MCSALLDLEDSFEVIKNGLGESSDASGLAEKYKELKQRIDDELQACVWLLLISVKLKRF